MKALTQFAEEVLTQLEDEVLAQLVEYVGTWKTIVFLWTSTSGI